MGREPISSTSPWWSDPDPLNKTWDELPYWRKALCILGYHEWLFDGYDWDGGYHCKHCLTNKPG